MYFTKSQLQKKEGIDDADATRIWSENYFNGWKHWITLTALGLAVVAIVMFSLPSWSWLNLLLMVHLFIAMPIGSRDMKNAVEEIKVQ